MPRTLALAIAFILSMPLAARNTDACADSAGKSFMVADVRVLGKGLQMVEGLQPLNFAVTVDGVHQPVCKLDFSPSPVSIGILLDSSASMAGSRADLFGSVTAAIKQMLDASNPQDEYFLEYVASSPRPLPQFTSDISQIRAGLAAKPKGETALIDSACLALAAMKGAHYPRRALLILSDGLDNKSKRSFQDLLQVYNEARVPIFLLLPSESWPGPASPAPEELLAHNHLIELVSQSGGISASAKGAREISEKTNQLASIIRKPYSLVFAGPQRSVSQHERLNLRIEVVGVNQRVQPLYRTVRMWHAKTGGAG